MHMFRPNFYQLSLQPNRTNRVDPILHPHPAIFLDGRENKINTHQEYSMGIGESKEQSRHPRGIILVFLSMMQIKEDEGKKPRNYCQERQKKSNGFSLYSNIDDNKSNRNRRSRKVPAIPAAKQHAEYAEDMRNPAEIWKPNWKRKFPGLISTSLINKQAHNSVRTRLSLSLPFSPKS